MGNQVVKISAAQFANYDLTQEVGIHLIYTRTDKEGKESRSALCFMGEKYTSENEEQKSVLNAWKSVFVTFWDVYSKIDDLKESNSGIRTKLTGSIPSDILVVTKNHVVKRWNIEGSVWSSIGLKPSKKDLERLTAAKTERERGRVVFKAALAAFDALKFKVNFAKYEEKKTEAQAEVREAI